MILRGSEHLLSFVETDPSIFSDEISTAPPEVVTEIDDVLETLLGIPDTSEKQKQILSEAKNRT